jgi:hypothetical protein
VSRTYAIAVCFVLFTGFASPAFAQRETRLGATAPTQDETRRAVPGSDSTRTVSVSHSALVGAGIGAGGGLLAGIIATHSSGVTDHSEDGLAYIALISAGALVGLVTGTIVGLARRH